MRKLICSFWLLYVKLIAPSRQFGNMLVLSTVYNSVLSELVDRNLYENLLRRTIRFLLNYRNISPTLRADAKILTDIYENVFQKPPDLNAATHIPK